LPNGILETATSFIPAGILFFMNKSFYFQHDYNAANDSKILFLRQQLGMEGYGLYWFILEQLAQSGGSLPLKIIPVLAMQSQTQETKLNAVVWNYELFIIDDKNFFSSRLNEHLALRKHLSDKGKQGAINRWKNSPPIAPPNSHPISDPNAKERKEKKEINKESKEIKAPTIQDVIKFFEDNGYTNAEKAWHYYNDADWKDSNGKPVLSWKQKMRVVWFKDENKKKIDEQEKIAAYNRDLWNRERAAIGLPPLEK